MESIWSITQTTVVVVDRATFQNGGWSAKRWHCDWQSNFVSRCSPHMTRHRCAFECPFCAVIYSGYTNSLSLYVATLTPPNVHVPVLSCETKLLKICQDLTERPRGWRNIQSRSLHHTATIVRHLLGTSLDDVLNTPTVALALRISCRPCFIGQCLLYGLAHSAAGFIHPP